MSEKKWTCKWTGSGRRGRRHKGKEYPRHTLQYYDGTHLSMRKRIWSKSQLHSVWREGKPAILSKYIIGLCNKYVGKPYQELKKAYDDRMRHFKKYYIRWGTLDDFVHKEPEKNPWRESFYIDDEGIVRKVKQKSRHRRTLTKKQRQFNERVNVPDFGQVRDDRRYPVRRKWGTHYDETTWGVPNKFKVPLLLGEFWVNYENRIFKIPVYTCCSEMFRDYRNHKGYHWLEGKRHPIPFHEDSYNKKYDWWVKKAIRMENEWIPIYVYGLAEGQSHIVRLHNHLVEGKKANIKFWKERIAEGKGNKEELEQLIQDAENSIQSMNEEALYDMGYGKYYTFMKRSDYDNFLRSITKQT